MSEPALVVRDLHVSYGGVRAVQGLSLEVQGGQVVALLGPNGAGKSSTLRAVSGVAPVVGGSIESFGEKLTGKRPDKIVSHGIAHAPEGREVFGQMTAEENLLLGATVRGSAASLPMIYELFPRLQERRRQRAGTLSGGEQQMLAIGRALMSEPRLLLLDEPSMGLAPIVVLELVEQLLSVARGGVSILLVEQNAAVALKLADYGYVMATGVLQRSGSADELAADDLMEAYIGA